jgi:hypothetical protein
MYVANQRDSAGKDRTRLNIPRRGRLRRLGRRRQLMPVSILSDIYQFVKGDLWRKGIGLVLSDIVCSGAFVSGQVEYDLDTKGYQHVTRRLAHTHRPARSPGKKGASPSSKGIHE